MSYPKFIDNSKFYRIDQSISQLDQLIRVSDNIKKIHELTSTIFDNFEEMISSYLTSGIEIFQMETGIVSHIDEEEQYIVKDVLSPMSEIAQGDIYEINNTYCYEVYKSRETLGFPRVGEMDEMKSHPVYLNLKLEAYLSAPIYVKDKLYGTLNFTSRQPREYGFSENEKDMIRLLSSSIGKQILLQEREQALLKLNDRMRRLVGFVSHDLRNPIGRITGLVNMLIEGELGVRDTEDSIKVIKDSSEDCLELINTVLDVAALGNGKISVKKEPLSIYEIVNEAIERHERIAKEKRIYFKINIPKELTVSCDSKRITQVFNNLIINSMKYSLSDSDNKVVFEYLEEKDERLYFSMTNPTVSEEKVQDELEDEIFRSIGYGLEICREILKLHDSDMVIENTNSFFIVKFDLSKSEK